MGEDEGAGKRSSLAGTMASINSWLTSSHKTRWLLGDQELEKRRAACYEKSLGEIERYKPESASTSAADNPVAVSLEEQKQLLSYYEKTLSKICSLFRMPRKILAISIVYLKRFYLKFTVLDHEPWRIMVTCVYLACKVENAYLAAEELAKGVQQDARVVEKIVLGSEMTLLQGLDFDLVVHTPYASLRGFLYELENRCQFEGWDPDRAETLSSALRKRANNSLDALLVATKKMEGEDKQMVESFFDHCRSKAGNTEKLAEFVKKVHKLGARGSASLADEGILKEIDRKVKLCRNPVYDPTSDQYKKQQAEKQAQKLRAKANLKRSAAASDARALGLTEIVENPDSKRRKSSPTNRVVAG